MQKTISKSKLKPKMLQVFREIEASGQGIIVTDRGRPTLRIEPIKKKRSVEDVFGPEIQGKIIYYEDINTPTTDAWSDI